MSSKSANKSTAGSPRLPAKKSGVGRRRKSLSASEAPKRKPDALKLQKRSLKRYIFSIIRSINPAASVSGQAMLVLDSMLWKIIDSLSRYGGDLRAHAGKRTLQLDDVRRSFKIMTGVRSHGTDDALSIEGFHAITRALKSAGPA